MKPKISVLLTTFERPEFLRRVLDGLTAQDLPHDFFEVVVVDDGSSTATRWVFEEVRPRLTHSSFVWQANAGVGAARNHGLAHCRADIVLMMDDDDVLSSDALSVHLSAHTRWSHPHEAVLGRTVLEQRLKTSPLMQFATEVSGFLFSERPEVVIDAPSYTRFWGGRTSFKKEFVLSAGGFNPAFRFGCEDIELGYRLEKNGLAVHYEPLATCTMIREISLQSFLSRLGRQGRSQALFSLLHPEVEVQSYCEIPSYRSEWPALKPRGDEAIRRALWLDGWVNRLHASKLDWQAHKEALYALYYQAFQAAKYGGIEAGLERAS